MKIRKQKWHGEAIFTTSEIPEEAKEFKPSANEISGDGLIVAESETTGNHHCVRMQEGVKFFRQGEDLFIRVEKKDAEVYNTKGVLGASGHTPINLEPGDYKVSYHNEYDPLTEMRRRVAD